MTNSDRKRGATAQVLNTDMLTNMVKLHFVTKGHALEDLEKLTASHNQLLATGADGRYAVVLGDEGVGCYSDENGVDIWFREGFIESSVQIPLEAVQTALTGETKDLADTIRTFGSRLEVNHGEWFKFITGHNTWDSSYQHTGFEAGAL